MRHLDTEPATAELAEGAYPAAFFRRALELLQLAAVEVEEAQDHAVGMHHELTARSKGDVGALDPRFDQHRLAWRRPVGRGKLGFVLVAQRQMQHEVEARAQPELRKRAAFHPVCRMASISTSAPRGRPATPMAARDGYGSRTYCAMISLTRAKWARSVRYTVMRTLCSRLRPAAVAIAARFRNTRCVWPSMPSAICMGAGSRPIRPAI